MSLLVIGYNVIVHRSSPPPAPLERNGGWLGYYVVGMRWNAELRVGVAGVAVRGWCVVSFWFLVFWLAKISRMAEIFPDGRKLPGRGKSSENADDLAKMGLVR